MNQETTSPASDDAACYAIVDSFRDALKKGKLQQRIHDEWCDVDPEQIPVGYVARAHHWRIVPHARAMTPAKDQANDQ